MGLCVYANVSGDVFICVCAIRMFAKCEMFKGRPYSVAIDRKLVHVEADLRKRVL